MKVIYIAGPYTWGNPDINAQKNLHYAEQLMELNLDAVPLPPLLCHWWHTLSPHKYDYWVRMTSAWVAKCDAVWRTPGISKGSDEEVRIAKSLELPVFFTKEELVKWLTSK